uniref:Protein BANP n=1 Tax=Myotis myotis TaxID=51298 RepID=A0A7J7SA77_MYOMY|nr:BTG3 associated nuclear protein [Myotis myotis]
MVAGSPLGATQTCNKVRCAVPGRRQNTIVVKVPGQEDSHNEDGESGSEASDSVSTCGQSGSQNIGNNVTLITLNSEEDYPNGTWLGDENNPEMRVRCAIIPSDMLHISTNCRTAEKMALTLLDYLFHREVQAVSNLSGQGKHGKKQLDPTATGMDGSPLQGSDIQVQYVQLAPVTDHTTAAQTAETLQPTLQPEMQLEHGAIQIQ